ncbi:MAG: exo-alpha-sialidase [Sedimentisphaerales bacterium]|nr:exo-alpha-sialidase [Sedimentisphaerales bacterium]
MFRRTIRWLSIIPVLVRLAGAGPEQVPGVVIHHIPSSSGVYVGSPGIAILSDGQYLAKHDEFGPGSTEHGEAVTRVFHSTDRGATWQPLATVKGMYWASIFVVGADAYLMGTSRNHGSAVISRSCDGGRTWTIPKDKHCGLLLDDAKYHCAPVPVVIHQGRIWRGMEDVMGPGGWGSHFRAFMMSAPADANLLDADKWIASNRLGRDPRWLQGQFRGWLEGNAVVTPQGSVADILRVDYRPEGEKAAIVAVSNDGEEATFDPGTGFIDFPGGAKKFTIRHDPVSRAYWTLSNPVLPGHEDPDPGRVRNAVALMRSADLRRWEIRCIVLYHPDVDRHGFQYPDWLFEGEDMIVASRTAYGQGADAAPRQHDANYLTFHRFKSFRTLTMNDSAPGGRPGDPVWSGRTAP